MSLKELRVHEIRNLKKVEIEPHPNVNIISGPNGSGKTSLLEAIYFLSTTRSFRSFSPGPLINYNSDRSVVYAQLGDRNGPGQTIGVSRDRDGSRQVHVNGESEYKASRLAELLPTIVLGPDSVSLLTGPPVNRRQFLNWGMFHVEHDFRLAWQAAQECLRQRNALLRTGHPNRTELASWTAQFVSAAEQLHKLRQEYMKDLVERCEAVIAALLGYSGIEVAYLPGWTGEEGLGEALKRQEELDISRGYTNSGHQRAEIKVKSEGRNVQDIFSRGELKLLSWSLLLAQGRQVEDLRGRRSIYLIDDLAAELDNTRQSALWSLLSETSSQIFVTAVDPENIKPAKLPHKMFHVKHGEVEFEANNN